jgi:hypothetical protein
MLPCPILPCSWVWPDASPAALVESAAGAAWPGLAPELDERGDAAHNSKHKWYFRYVPVYSRPWGSMQLDHERMCPPALLLSVCLQNISGSTPLLGTRATSSGHRTPRNSAERVVCMYELQPS